jgi:hypothetical protein
MQAKNRKKEMSYGWRDLLSAGGEGTTVFVLLSGRLVSGE